MFQHSINALLLGSKHNKVFNVSNLGCAYINTKIIIITPLNTFCPKTEIKTNLAINSVSQGNCVHLYWPAIDQSAQ